MKIVSAQWMRELDQQAINQIGLPAIVLMENAARAAALFFKVTFPAPTWNSACIVVGKGNNGGDGLAIGRILSEYGYHVLFALLAPPSEFTPDSALNYAIVQKLGLVCRQVQNVADFTVLLNQLPKNSTFLVDAIFGTGLTTPIKPGLAADVIASMNESALPIAAVDLPSGLADTFLPDQGVHIKAHCTGTFQWLKSALLLPDGCPDAGNIGVLDIGIPHGLLDNQRYYIDLITPESFSCLLEKRPRAAHKGHFGHVLTVAGSVDKPGAGILSASAALKIGAGLSTAACVPENRALMVNACPELMTLPQTSEQLRAELPRFNVILAGPGLGHGQIQRQLLAMLLECSQAPLILDADALTMWPVAQGIPASLHAIPVIITPHPGEFCALTGLSSDAIGQDRMGRAREFAMQHRQYVILKGHHTLIATPEGQVFVNQTGNPGMATAGSGDVLAGVIAGLVAQFYPRQSISVILQAAVFLHGYAADIAARTTGEMGLMAHDILATLPRAMATVDDFQSSFSHA